MGNTTRSRTACPLAEVSLVREAALPVSSQSAPPSARVSCIDGFSWVIDELVRDMLSRAVFVTEHDVFLGDMGVRSLVLMGEFAFHRSQTIDEIVPMGERRFQVYESVLSHRKTLRCSFTDQSLLKTVYTPLVEIPD